MNFKVVSKQWSEVNELLINHSSDNKKSPAPDNYRERGFPYKNQF